MNYEQFIALVMLASSFSQFFTSVFLYCLNDPHLYSSLYKVADKLSPFGTQHSFSENEDQFYSSNLSSLYADFAFFPQSEKVKMREYVREMFYHGYNGYMENAFPLDELNPINCTGRGPDSDRTNIHVNDALGNFSLTLIDALDTLYVLGDKKEFLRAVKIITDNVSFDTDTNVQVFEVNIRVLGGLLSAHILASSEMDNIKRKSDTFSDHHNHNHKPNSPQNKESEQYSYAETETEPQYDNELYDLALDLGARLLPAFLDSPSGLPHPRVNLRHGVLHDSYLQQNINCLAGVGTLSLEFGLLSHLSGDPIYERVARKALSTVWSMRNNDTRLFGNSFDIHSMEWRSHLSGLGAGMDSFYEYLIKAYVMFNEEDYLTLFSLTHF